MGFFRFSVLALFALGCGALDAASSGEQTDPNTPLPGGDSNPLPPGDNTPQEVEVESLYQAPVATGRSIWVANPQSGRVALIDAERFDVLTVDAGDGPTHLAPVPGRTGEAVIVLNTLSDDATLIERRGDGVALSRYPVAPQLNAWALSHSGRFAIAWADARRVPTTPATQGFQELSVLDLSRTGDDPRAATTLAVGYRPLSIHFSADESRALAVTQDGVMILDLSGERPALARHVPLSADPLAQAPLTRDVVVTPDGDYALVRRDGQSTVEVLRLRDGARATVSAPAEVSDLDLSEAGSTAVLVMRQSAQVALLPVPAIFDAPTQFATHDLPGLTFGQAVLAPATNTALLFSNATSAQEQTALTLLPLDAPDTWRSVRLYAPLLGVFPAPSGRDAVVLHRDNADGSGGFSLVRLSEALPARIATTEASPFSVAVTDQFAVITERSDQKKKFAAQIADFGSLSVKRFALSSPPLAAGIVSDLRRAYISQAHPDGRITFIDFDSEQARTITGFELGSRVVTGGNVQ